MNRIPFFDRLRDARRIVIAGAGGGFEVYGGLPLALALHADGREVHLGSLSLVNVYGLGDGFARITPASEGPSDYFPERTLAAWLATEDLTDISVYAFPRTGVRPLRAAYRGDEAALGTPVEDATSPAAVLGTTPSNPGRGCRSHTDRKTGCGRTAGS